MSLIDKLTKLDKSTRTISMALIVLAVAYICYHAIAGPFLARLKAAKAECADIRKEYIEQESLITDLGCLQTKLAEAREGFNQLKSKCFTNQQAERFLENITTMAQSYNVTTVSRRIAKPKSLIIEDPEQQIVEEKPEQQEVVSFEIHSAQVVVAGDFYDIVNFIKVLEGRSEKVSITDIRIGLPPGGKFHPRAWFNITVLAELPMGDKK